MSERTLPCGALANTIIQKDQCSIYIAGAGWPKNMSHVDQRIMDASLDVCFLTCIVYICFLTYVAVYVFYYNIFGYTISHAQLVKHALHHQGIPVAEGLMQHLVTAYRRLVLSRTNSLTGANCVILSDHVVKNPAALVQTLITHKVTHMTAVPTLLQALIPYLAPSAPLHSAFHSNVSSEHIPDQAAIVHAHGSQDPSFGGASTPQLQLVPQPQTQPQLQPVPEPQLQRVPLPQPQAQTPPQPQQQQQQQQQQHSMTLDRSSRLKVVVSSGEPLTHALAGRLQGCLPESCCLLNLYGTTEVAADCTCFDYTRHNSRADKADVVASAGLPAPDAAQSAVTPMQTPHLLGPQDGSGNQHPQQSLLSEPLETQVAVGWPIHGFAVIILAMTHHQQDEPPDEQLVKKLPGCSQSENDVHGNTSLEAAVRARRMDLPQTKKRKRPSKDETNTLSAAADDQGAAQSDQSPTCEQPGEEAGKVGIAKAGAVGEVAVTGVGLTLGYHRCGSELKAQCLKHPLMWYSETTVQLTSKVSLVKGTLT